MPNIPLKRRDKILPIRTFESTDGNATYLVFKQGDGSYHTFVEVEAKEAAMQCGSTQAKEVMTREHWNKLWGDE